jgi:hypothetical protein
MIFIASNLAHVLSFSPALLAAAQRPYTVDPNHHARAHIEPAFSDAEVADMATEYMRDMNIKQSVEQYRPHLLAPLHAVLMAAAELLLCAPLEAQWMFAEHVCVPALAFFSTLKHHECFDVATMQTFVRFQFYFCNSLCLMLSNFLCFVGYFSDGNFSFECIDACPSDPQTSLELELAPVGFALSLHLRRCVLVWQS